MFNRFSLLASTLAINSLVLSACGPQYQRDIVYEDYMNEPIHAADPVSFIKSYIGRDASFGSSFLGNPVKTKEHDTHVVVTVSGYSPKDSYKTSGDLAVALKDFCKQQDGNFYGHWCIRTKDSSLDFLFYLKAVTEYDKNDYPIIKGNLIAPPNSNIKSDSWNRFASKEFDKDIRNSIELENIEKKEIARWKAIFDARRLESKLILEKIGHQVCKRVYPFMNYPIYIGYIEGASDDRVKVRLHSWKFFDRSFSYNPQPIHWDYPQNWFFCNYL